MWWSEELNKNALFNKPLNLIRTLSFFSTERFLIQRDLRNQGKMVIKGQERL